jgi:hypothetical protein
LKPIIFVGNGRDFHAIDWYRNIKKLAGERVYYATDLLESESYARLLDENDKVLPLFNIDKFLFRKQSDFGNKWRNMVKFFFLPVQVKKLKKISQRFPEAIYHAHTMYYLMVCMRAGVKYIGSPQGDEVLIRPYQSDIYRKYAVEALSAADALIVDSLNMKNGIAKLSGKNAFVVQYGIDTAGIEMISQSGTRTKITSIRAWYPLYRISEIIKARKILNDQPLTFFYPFLEEGYKTQIKNTLTDADEDLGRLPSKNDLYKVLKQTLLAISIPESDSSPRSVYESIFCGCIVATTYNPWIENVPECMHQRIIVVDLENKFWLKDALEAAKEKIKHPFVPSEEALNIFDQERSMKFVLSQYYN